LWDCCVGVCGTFRTIPTVESYGAGVFCSGQNPYLIAVKLLKKALNRKLYNYNPMPPMHKKFNGCPEQMLAMDFPVSNKIFGQEMN
jgi:hypothetical protein